jgi:AcrR family transcriptional regulator
MTQERAMMMTMTERMSARRAAVRRLAGAPTTDRRAQTQRRLLDAGRTVIAENGVGGASVGLITSAAGFSRGAFYSNFQDMDHFVEQVAHREWESVLVVIGRSLNAALDQSPAGGEGAPDDEGVAAAGTGAGPAPGAARATSSERSSSHVADRVATGLLESTRPLLLAGRADADLDNLTRFAQALLAAVPRDREFYLLWTSLSNFMVRFPEGSAHLRAAFIDFHDGMAEYLVDALDALGLEPAIDPGDIVDLVIAIGARSMRSQLVSTDHLEGELIDRLLPVLIPTLIRVREAPSRR